jgi:hypothetical protein
LSLDLSGTGVTALPDGLTVGGSLDLSGTGVTALPDGLTVGGYLDLSGTGVTALPDGLTVGGSLDLSGTGVTALPDGLTVGGSLDLSGTFKSDSNYLFSADIGSRKSITIYHKKKDKIYCGCFRGSLTFFELKVHDTYKLGNIHRGEYDFFIEQCQK